MKKNIRKYFDNQCFMNMENVVSAIFALEKRLAFSLYSRDVPFVMLSAAKASVLYLKNSFCLAFSHIQMLSLRSA
jgi:hypothetical protein